MSQKKFRPGAKVLNKLLNNRDNTSASNGASSSLFSSSHAMGMMSAHSSAITPQNHTSSNASPIASPINLVQPHSTINLERVEKKLFEKTYKLIEKVLKYCQSEKMNLINSPPYIIDIMPDTYNYLNQIFNIYENKLHILNEITYFVVFVNNLITKLEFLVNLFKQAGKRMFEESSEERKTLTKYSLIFSHMFGELKSIFPSYIYEGQNFRIAKSDAADFWKSNFCDRVIVPWREFEIKLSQVHPIHSDFEANELRATIQLTGTRFVSIFEFDVFTRLFQPWNTLLNNWNYLAFKHPGYGAFMTYDEVYKRLQNHLSKPGCYLFRLSCTKLGQWAIGYVTSDKKILQTIPQSLVQALIDGEKQGLYLYPDGREVHIDIVGQLAVAAAERITISKEQYDMYCDMGTSFQVCKICSENNKDRKLEPCGHLICSTCLENWQEKHAVASCPFCRCEIKAFEPVVIAPFESASNGSSKDQKSTITSTINEDSSPKSDKSAKANGYFQPNVSPPKKNGHRNSKALIDFSRSESDDECLGEFLD